MRRRRTDSLTEREREVLGLVAAGHSSGRIAASLGLSCRTIEAHVRAAMSKLGASTRAHAVVLASDQISEVRLVELRCGQRRLLSELASGKTVSAASKTLHISRRTAHRWLEQTRHVLGADTNVEVLFHVHGSRHPVAQIDDGSREAPA